MIAKGLIVVLVALGVIAGLSRVGLALSDTMCTIHHAFDPHGTCGDGSVR